MSENIENAYYIVSVPKMKKLKRFNLLPEMAKCIKLKKIKESEPNKYFTLLLEKSLKLIFFFFVDQLINYLTIISALMSYSIYADGIRVS